MFAAQKHKQLGAVSLLNNAMMNDTIVYNLMVALIVLGYAAYVMGRYFQSLLPHPMMVLFLKIMPLVIAVSLLVFSMMNKVYYDNTLMVFIPCLMALSILRFFAKWDKDW